jgi:hypothetical protein
VTEPYDVVIVTDCRLPGGTAASVAEEVRAQAAAGLTSALVHVESALVARPRGFNPRLVEVVEEGLADVLAAGEEVAARLAVLRHPGVLASARGAPPHLAAQRTLGVINQPPWDAQLKEQYYDLDAARRFVAHHVDADAAWVPIGPQVREQLARQAPDLELLPDDWVNVIDVDRWAVDPDHRFRGERLVVGRHSRPDARKWPADEASLLAAYPDEPWLDVRVLGGAEPARRILGHLPAAWTVLPFGARPVDRFLAELDAFVYFHHPAWVEAFGRTVLEALASGTVVVLPEHLSDLFGDLAVTTTVDGVPEVLADLWADHDAARDRARRGQQLTRERFGHGVHQRRVRGLLEATESPSAATGPSPRSVAAAVPASDRAEHGGSPGVALRRRRVLVLAVGDEREPLTGLHEVAANSDVELLTCRVADAALPAPVPAGSMAVEVLPSHLAALPAGDRGRLLRGRLGDLIDELDLTGVILMDGGVDGRSGSRAAVSGEELMAACRDACSTRPQVATVRWSDVATPEARPTSAATAEAALRGLQARPVGEVGRAGSPGRLRLPLKARELAERLWANLPERVQRFAERVRALRSGRPQRIAVPAAGMLSEAEVRVASGVAVVLRGKASGDAAHDTVGALRRHQLLHRDVLPLLVWEPGTEPGDAALGYPSEALPGGFAGIRGEDRRRRRLALLRRDYDVEKVLVLEAPEDLEDPAVRSVLEDGEA